MFMGEGVYGNLKLRAAEEGSEMCKRGDARGSKVYWRTWDKE